MNKNKRKPRTYVFGYGSLMNPASLRRTLPGVRLMRKSCLRGYQRKFNAPVDGYLYLNIVSRPGKTVCGVLIAVSAADLKRLKKREIGYRCVEVTTRITERVAGRVVAFIAPDRKYPALGILKSYLRTCLRGVSPRARKRWLRETIIRNPVYDDCSWPKYRNVAGD